MLAPGGGSEGAWAPGLTHASLVWRYSVSLSL